MPGQLFLAGNADLLVRRAHGQDDRVGGVLAVVGAHDLDVAAQLEPGHVVGDQFGAEAFGLGTDLAHQVRAHDAVGEAREVLDVGGVHQCAAVLAALEHQRLEIGPRAVERCGIARRAGADDDHLAVLVLGHIHVLALMLCSVRRWNESRGAAIPGAVLAGAVAAEPRAPAMGARAAAVAPAAGAEGSAESRHDRTGPTDVTAILPGAPATPVRGTVWGGRCRTGRRGSSGRPKGCAARSGRPWTRPSTCWTRAGRSTPTRCSRTPGRASPAPNASCGGGWLSSPSVSPMPPAATCAVRPACSVAAPT